jgi:hypothetical protein
MKIKLLAIAALFFLASIPAEAHGPLPLPSIHLRLPKLLFTSKGNYPAYGQYSGATRAFLEQAHSITTLGFSTGFNQTITQGISGQILSGQLYGTLYERTGFEGPNSYLTFAPYIAAFGKNPLSLNGGVPNGLIAPTTLPNQIIFSGTSSISQFTGLNIVKSRRPYDPPYLSGAQRAFQNRLNLLTRNAINAGVNRANSLLSSPIIAGQFYGYDYAQFTPGVLTYHMNLPFVYSFGSDPLNILKRALVQLNPSTLRNYVEFANGQVVTYTSGLIPASMYFPGKPFATEFIYAIGNNPLNYFNNPAAAPAYIYYSVPPTPYLSQ